MTLGGGRGGRSRRRREPAATVLAMLGAACLAVAACGGTSPSLPALATSSPSTSIGIGTPTPDGSGGPQATPWTGNAVLGIEAMGLADGQITAALADLGQGIANEDLAVIRRAAEGLAGLEVLLPNLEKIRTFAPMATFADQYETAITTIDAAAQDVVDAIDAEDPPAITASIQALVEALRLYTAAQPQLATFVQESIAQRRLLLR